MTFKLIGAVLIIFGTGLTGFIIVHSYKHTVHTLMQFIIALEDIQNELRYRRCPLSDVFRKVNTECSTVNTLFYNLSDELDNQISPDAYCCVNAVLAQAKDIPKVLYSPILLMGKNLGHFDIEGQIKGLSVVEDGCKVILNTFTTNQEVRLRSYQTLAVCAGIATVMLLL